MSLVTAGAGEPPIVKIEVKKGVSGASWWRSSEWLKTSWWRRRERCLSVGQSAVVVIGGGVAGKLRPCCSVVAAHMPGIRLRNGEK